MLQFHQFLNSFTRQTGFQMSQIILERTGDSHWYLKGTNAGESPEIAAAMVKWSVELNDDVDADD